MNHPLWSHEDIEAVTAFVQTYCAIQVDETEGTKEGYFAFYQGKTARNAKNVRANVPRGEVTSTTALVLRRCRELVYSEEGDVFLRYYETGDSHCQEQLRIRGRGEGSTEIETSTGSAVGDLASALVRTNQQLLDQNHQLMGAVEGYHVQAVQEREQLTLAVIHGAIAEQAGSSLQLEEALKVIAPTLEAVGPKLADALLLWLGGGVGLPTEPGPRMEAGIQRVLAAAQELGKTIHAHPEEWTVERRQPLAMLLVQLAPALGYQVVPLPPREVPPPDGAGNGASP